LKAFLNVYFGSVFLARENGFQGACIWFFKENAMDEIPEADTLRAELARGFRDDREPHFKRLMTIVGGQTAEERYSRLAEMAGVTADRMKNVRTGIAHLRTRGSDSEFSRFDAKLSQMRESATADQDDLLLALFEGLDISTLATPTPTEKKRRKEEAHRRLRGVVDLGAIELSFVEVSENGRASLASPAFIVRSGGAIRLVPVPPGANADANIVDGEIRAVAFGF